jgi:hypothetical protein
MYRVVLDCTGIDVVEGRAAARDIERAFAENRPHHQNVSCSFANGTLTLTAENDFDPKGLALMDELSDCICAYVKGGCDDIVVKSVAVI